MITLTPSNALPNTYSLNWSNQQNHIFDGLRNLVGQDDLLLTDVTLACDGEYIQAHKLVLSLCSSFFKDLFLRNKADKQNTIIILGNVTALNLRYLLQFMYQGKVDIPSKDVDSFLQAGNLLKIEGLIGGVGDTKQTPTDPNVSHHHQQAPSPSVSLRPVRTQNAPTIQSTSSNSKAAIPVSPAGCESPTIPNKKPRLAEAGPSGSSLASSHSGSNDAAPVIVGQPVTLSVSSNQGQAPSDGVFDPLDDSEQYDPGEMEGDGEEGIDFNNLKTEPIHVYSHAGYGESDQSEMMHNEGIGDDSYGGSIDDSYGISQAPSSLQMPGTMPSVSVPGPSTSSQRRGGSIPASKIFSSGQLSGYQKEDGYFYCRECEKRFKTRAGLIFHFANHTEDKYGCPDCDRAFESLKLLNQHRTRNKKCREKKKSKDILKKKFQIGASSGE